MATIWNHPARTALVMRAGALTPGHRARWGQFGVSGMVAHLNDSMRMALGDLTVHAKAPSILRWAPVRYLVIHLLPMPKSAPTAPELLARTSGADLARELETFVALLARFDGRVSLAATHPVFGRMTSDDWGALIHKHTDHHLRQFGA
ncbi:MAG: DUF1569 domain-containing protein [Vicinamibacterales bacterium]